MPDGTRNSSGVGSVLIVGVTGGIGAALASGFVEVGRQVLGTYRANSAAARALEDRFEGAIRTLPLDLEDVSSIQQVATLSGADDGVDVVILAAGLGGRPQMLVRGTPARVQSTISVNLTGQVLLVQALIRDAIARGRKRPMSFITISSVSAVRPEVGMSVYAAAKAGLEIFFQSCAAEYATRGFRFNIVRAGPVLTPMLAELPEAACDRMLRRLHSDGFPPPSSLFPSVLFAALPSLSPGLNGAVIHVDHGYTLTA